MNDPKSIQCLKQIAAHFKKYIEKFKNGDGSPSVIFSGCGTSGRLAFFCSRSYNTVLNAAFPKSNTSNVFRYIMAGGDTALLIAKESVEDNPHLAVDELKKYLTESKEYMYVGITCGLSAPFVAGQLDFTMKADNIVSVLLGFNAVELARNNPIEGWDKTFRQVADELVQKMDENHIILNPIVGPEGVTGSTRMKGGSATKILLDVAFASSMISFCKMKHSNFPKLEMTEEEVIFQLLQGFETAYRHTYQYVNQIGKLIDYGQHALRNDGHIYYLGCDTAGILGFIDASECTPTYGAKLDDVRGFIRDGWEGLGIHESIDEKWKIDFKAFEENILPNVSDNDFVVFLVIEQVLSDEALKEMIDIYEKLKQRSNIAWVWISHLHSPSLFFTLPNIERHNSVKEQLLKDEVLINVKIPHVALIPELYGYAEFSIKLILNAITTGAHVLKGTVYSNRMINLTISNSKLFDRAVGIVSNIMKVDTETATKAIYSSLYDDDHVDVEKMRSIPVSDHIAVAIKKEKVVPTAMLLASGKFSVKEAKEKLQEVPIIRNAIK
jgi:N-acetylmuramic acid 6-phosphate (MurNAc-6-P) etherase